MEKKNVTSEKNINLHTGQLSVGYGQKVIVDNVNIAVEEGKILTLLGPNGSGKSTLLKTFTRQIKKLSGEVYICGENAEEISENAYAKVLSMVMTERVNPELMTCREVVETGRYPYTGRFGILKAEDHEKVREAMEIVSAAEVADQPFDSISDGQRQRVMLARAICQEPKILILDEPTAHLDIRFKLEILLRIRKLAADKKMAIVMSLHEPDLAAKVSDCIVAVDKDGIQKIGTPKEIVNKEFICKLYGIGQDEFAFLTEGENWWELSETAMAENVEENSNRQRTGAKVIMVQGTMSNAGKSLLAAGLCRIFKQDGYRVAPFKSQNMSLNSYITEDGLEMGRAQVMQAECCGLKPMVEMNPILLKPTDDVGSQVIVNGEVIGNMRARDYFKYKPKLIPDIKKAYERLSEIADIIVVEGAGSPAEINLKSNDIVNMGLAKILDAPVLLVGDIDRGGVFAQLIGTLELSEPEELARIKGLIINKFRGDKSLLDSGVTMLEEKGRVPVVGVVPYMDIQVEDEDSLSERFGKKKTKQLDIAVIRFPHISNFTDMNVFEQIPEISVRYVRKLQDLGQPQMIVLPGTKNTISDLRWLKESGFAEAMQEQANAGTVIWGICGGYQMLGEMVADPDGTEIGGEERGLGILPVKTVLKSQKNRSQYQGEFEAVQGQMQKLSGLPVTGYEIHMGETLPTGEVLPLTSGKTGYQRGNVYGSYIHGIFDNRVIVTAIAQTLAALKQVQIDVDRVLDYREFKETQYDKMAEILREHLDMDAIYKILDC